ncbi:MAG: ABC transporter permease [Armatimonadota bacterium]
MWSVARLAILETLRRKEFYVLLVLILVLAVWMQVANPGGSGAGRFAKDIVMQVVWLASFGLAVPLAARQIPQDLEQKSIYIVMARPIHRSRYVFGRMAGAAAASVICFTSMFAVLVAMLVLKGAGSLSDASLWQSYALQVAALVMLSSTAILFSAFSSPAGAVSFSLLVLAVMRYGGTSILRQIESMQGLPRDLAWAGYLAMPHFEFFNTSQRVVHGLGPLPLALFAGILCYGLVFSVFATACAALIFRRRWL